MFEHVTLLLSFVFALALTHLLTSATELVIAGKGVRFSGLYTLWAINAAFLLMNNWVAFYSLSALKQWTSVEILLQFLLGVMQYFTCSVFRVSQYDEGSVVDLPKLYQQRRLLIFGAFLMLGLIAVFQNWWDRNNTKGMAPSDWIAEDLAVVPMMIVVIIAGLARPMWMQWVAVVVMTGLNIFSFCTTQSLAVRPRHDRSAASTRPTSGLGSFPSHEPGVSHIQRHGRAVSTCVPQRFDDKRLVLARQCMKKREVRWDAVSTWWEMSPP